MSAAGCALFTSHEEGQLQQATVGELTALLKEREAAVQTMKGLFTAKIKGGMLPIAQRVEGAMYYRRPDAMRLQGFTALGGELFEFVVAEQGYRLRLPTMGRELAGRPDEMDKMGKIARPFQLSMWAMNGVVGTTAIAQHERAVLAEDGDRYRLDVFTRADSGGAETNPTRRIWFDRRMLLVVQEDRLSAKGEVEAVMYFDDCRPRGEPVGRLLSNGEPSVDSRLLRPFKIRMEDGQGQGSLQLTFHEIVPNAQLKAADLGSV
ncbi:MAG: hypothetical protein ACT4OO_14560 [Nitrospiraceae bacterium]